MRQSPKRSDSILDHGRGKCRICAANLTPVIDFGKMPLANAFLAEKDFSSEYFFHLSCGFCDRCALFQLVDQPPAEFMFHSSYPFFTGSSQFMKKHYASLAADIQNKYLSDSGLIVEMGSNDGTFLSNFKNKNMICLGIDPSENAAKRATDAGIPTRVDFFSSKVAKEIVGSLGEANVFVGTNVLCHIPTLPDIFKGLQCLLSQDGVAVFEDPYLPEILQKTAYDQIYDEHVYLFSATALSRIVKAFGLKLFDAELVWTHGGSLRYFISRSDSDRTITNRLQSILDNEMKSDLLSFEPYAHFARRVQESRSKLVELLQKLKKQGAKITGYGATSKSTTVLNYCGIDSALIETIYDTTPEKQGKYTPGSHILVRPWEEFAGSGVSHTVLFAWNHAQEIMQKEVNYQSRGGRWIQFIPEVALL